MGSPWSFFLSLTKLTPILCHHDCLEKLSSSPASLPPSPQILHGPPVILPGDLVAASHVPCQPPLPTQQSLFPGESLALLSPTLPRRALNLGSPGPTSATSYLTASSFFGLNSLQLIEQTTASSPTSPSHTGQSLCQDKCRTQHWYQVLWAFLPYPQGLGLSS